MTCPYIYATGGLRIESGTARVVVNIDGLERELRVVRDGKGRSRLEKGEISLSDLEEMEPDRESFDVLVEHKGVDLKLSIDPRNAMGRRGRDSVEDLKQAIEKIDPVSRKILAELQMETLPYGTENAAESLERIKWALYQADHLRVSDDALHRSSMFMDKEAADMLLERHPDLASRISLQVASGVAPGLSASTSHALRDSLSAAGFLDEAGSVPLLRDWNLSSGDLQDLALAGATLDKKYGALVKEIPLSVWSITRGNGFTSLRSSLAGYTEADSQIMRDVEGREMTLRAAVWDVQGGKVIFGAHPDSVWPDGVVSVSRNPYEITGLSPETAQGREMAIAYSAAIAAVSAANQSCIESTANRCSADGKCVECFTEVMPALRDASRAITGLKAGAYDPDTTVVDALLYRAARGDDQAAIEFRALADLGERMIEVSRNPDRRRGITQRMLEEYRGLGYTAYSVEEPMRLNALSTWRSEQLDRLASAVAAGDVSREWAPNLQEGIIKLSNDVGFGNTYREVVTRPIHNASETFASREGGLKTAGLGLEDMYLVHETSYAPQRDSAGNVLLRPTGDYNERYLRPTVHFTVNHTATGHMFRQGDDATHAIVVRLSDVIAHNPDSLDCLYAIDTYLSPMPGEPLVLPAASVRTVSFEEVPGADSESADERQKSRTSRVLREMNELQSSLTGDPASTVFAFPAGTHYSSSPVDSRLRELASELGVATGLHQNHAVSYIEKMDDLSQMRCGSVYKWSLTPENLSQMSRAARARIMTGGRFSGVTAYAVANPDEDSIV